MEQIGLFLFAIINIDFKERRCFMSIAIIGGNECMNRKYKEICKAYDCKAKIYEKSSKSIRNIGYPDLMVLFVGAMSHKMLIQVSSTAKKNGIKVIHCRTSSASALKNALDEHVKKKIYG